MRENHHSSSGTTRALKRATSAQGQSVQIRHELSDRVRGNDLSPRHPIGHNSCLSHEWRNIHWSGARWLHV